MGKFETFVAFGDAHGDMACRESINALEKHIEEFKPQHRICLGDFFDFRALRKGIGNDESDAYDNLVSDTTAGYMWLDRLRPTVFLNGNHEHRLYRVAEEAANGLVREYAIQGVKKLEGHLRKMGCKVYPYHYEKGVHTIRKVAFIHGYVASQAAGKHSAEVYSPPGGATVMGHLHRIEAVHAVRHGGAQGYSGGCLADIPRLHYAATRHGTMRWANGWLYGVIGKKGYKIWQAEKVEDNWMHP